MWNFFDERYGEAMSIYGVLSMLRITLPSTMHSDALLICHSRSVTNIQSDPLNLTGWIMDAMSTTIILLGFSSRKHLTTVGIDLSHGDIGWRYLPEKLAYSVFTETRERERAKMK
ncbi:hypothetical protein CMV_022637 [Castanea mollissima]|uniref:Uncharacterized protein n=1 Tax=Castanea mollissima TaxID=60419 RepID=A0A8J4QRZ0_9ROSI|nr:hypothetical protein CMV_022637 [Castanea mollissima]